MLARLGASYLTQQGHIVPDDGFVHRQWASYFRGAGGSGVRMAAIMRRDPCAYCGGDGGTVDHIHPMSLGGLNWWWNMTGSCDRCNQRKGRRMLLQFMVEG